MEIKRNDDLSYTIEASFEEACELQLISHDLRSALGRGELTPNGIWVNQMFFSNETLKHLIPVIEQLEKGL